ncbi:amino acid permease [Rhizorhabdus histidinilytica]|jgi:ethanolamine permease|uniref:Ethanolamine:proton symporter, EAT family n=1 Tax=Rhizorhabdus histidinilytica TaxID=439228 RepID=A0A1T5CUW6_9SPHN|nr:amino acid permease [Rhizorhabdus histidinilytica]QEH79055.1 amino acid permease [Sphingomonas sp. C8-2]SKB63249.1 ethanolamine:proton symporter, EAT family [Rhizorhabdus histidinilytica]
MTLARSTIDWRHVAGLGVALVIAGQFSGWNYGLASAGWANMIVATLLMASLSFGLAQCLAELSAARPHAGGLYIYCEDAFGPFAGYLVGCAVVVALTIGTGAAAEFISAYATHVFGFGGWPLKIGIFAIILLLHLRGVGEAMRLMVGAGLLAMAAILLFGLTMLPHFDPANLTLPGQRLHVDPRGVFSCIPFAIWLFIAVEQTAAAAEEVAEPARNMPRGIIAAVLTLLVTAMVVLVLGVGGGGIQHIGAADDPLYAAMASPEVGGTAGWTTAFVGLGGIVGLLGTLFSLIYSTSRQIFALARDGRLPAILGRTNKRGAPDLALLLVVSVGVGMSAISPDKVLLIVVLSLSLSYVVLLASFIRLRLTRPDLPRPFRAAGGIGTALVCMLLSSALFAACFQVDTTVLAALGLLFAVIVLSYLRLPVRGAQPSSLLPEERSVDAS